MVTVTGGNATIQANFISQYTLTVSNNGYGNTVPLGDVMFGDGANINVNAIPNADYHFVNWTQICGSGAVVFGDPTSATTTVTVTGGDAAIQANFAINQYALTVNSDGNGSITSSGNTTVNNGAATSITATPNADYHFVNWTQIGGSGTVVFGDPTSATTTVTITGGDAVIQANFEINQYVLTITNLWGGRTTPSGKITVNSGANTLLTATPNNNYHFVRWVQIGGKGKVIFGNPTSATTTATMTGGNTTILAFFAPGKTKECDTTL